MNQGLIDKTQQEWVESWVSRALAVGDEALHVGCGEKYIAGAVNIDPNTTDSRIKPDYHLDVHDMAPVFADGRFGVIVSNHVIPSLAEPARAFIEMGRVLRVGGIMAHVIPDWRYAPARKDQRRPFEYQPCGWEGPGYFSAWLKMIDAISVIFETVELESFTEFNWSFKWVARKR